MGLINLRGRALYRIMSGVCALAFMMFGYDAGVLAGVQATEPFLSAIGHPERYSTVIIPMIASSYTLGAWVMSMVISFIGSPMGRRNCILAGNILVLVGGTLQASTFSVAQIIVGRVLCGFGIGFISSTVPTYMAEMSTKPTDHGPEVCFQSVVLILGVALSGWVDFGFTRMHNQVSWRFPIAFQTFFAITSGIGILLLPDTPRWYYIKGRTEEGDQVLSALHDLPIDHEHVQAQRTQILRAIDVENSQEAFKLSTLLWDNTELQAGRRLRTSAVILGIQQLMGINQLVYYSTIIFSQVGLTPFYASILAAVMNTVFAMGTFFTPATIERGGRRGIMLWSSVLLTVLLLIFVVMINLGDLKSSATQWTAVAAVVGYVFVFGYGWVGIPWLYGPEIAPLRYRHLGGSFGATGEWSMTFVTVFAGGVALERVGPKIWVWYLTFCFVSILFVYFYCPETSGKTLEEIDAIFMRHSPTLSDTNLEGAYVDHLPTKSSNMVAENDKVEKHEIGSTHIG
ncbi:uncharacterized protein HMPREF1541_07130 [Cyphellophora europaea CBS 101466]|uniref:Major facilitator superfamily (MFS) profile domain-containing protein n=1 Tax=Cyphellophora europaea (strain CBS 101466) TaxID=1220924 RepID=W2RP94_CYPE1|nr:uncharacterized protein HMPREF1541_07130 [Cyphellophora europaea CBS 101466]ETN37508.1 hypothetical protein HMPREF1541_07130 [Cyphellophora europaea CBS 101466]